MSDACELCDGTQFIEFPVIVITTGDIEMLNVSCPDCVLNKKGRVYVDELDDFGWVMYGRPTQSCHMMADTDSALEEMARTLKLKPQWRHGDHYDLIPSKRKKAVEAGAIEVRAVDLVNLRRLRKKAPLLVQNGIFGSSPSDE